ncbi:MULTISPECIES: ComEA family DNA-binding protein [Pseudomonas]|uniref:Helix-hairpin-helix domain-containing protein n=1 Tax=Pseudomonas protegens TaxID=380021 RepID=A0A2T6GDJ0_9PSED|nr:MULTISPECIES: helix-hairpin-helix domain-containing protein [Pseudomonas]PUA42227.1 helix-hairpin-helix domain-containing protein [Pseudomonas protegens]RXU63613.1 competence protein ComEA [Pseudomonas protegens]ULT72524.1 helix-hairpin-helix domain-containing protein [Pseudomonas sp. BC42]BAQ76072.1 competence protein ComEA [Pseudomonas sp. Os17]BAQ82239.1 competence protein ComEA [Pseudomonas sp. St29]
MQNSYFLSLIFAFLASLSLTTQAAPLVNAPASSPEIVELATAQSGKVNINTADQALLQRELFGIGEAKAKAIVAYREENGPFASVDELLEVKGIGKTILERNRDKLEVN